MFKSAVSKLKNDFFEGDFVTLKGRISIYEQNARLQFYVSSVEMLGEGKFLKEFYELKERLGSEGVFDTKRELKDFPSKIALLTSKSSAAIEDYKKIIRLRNPLVELLEYEINMQSNETPSQIINALEGIDDSVDLIVITRGGGSYEDLRYFNDEALARYISSYKTPIISAIGHEIDYTIIEFASDYRAATPSEAATMSSSDLYKYLSDYYSFIDNMTSSIEKDINLLKIDSNRYIDSINFVTNKRISGFLYETEKLINETTNIVSNKILMAKEALERDFIYLDSMNPLHIMDKGYSISLINNKTIKSIKQVSVDEKMEIRLKDGRIISEVREVVDEVFKEN